MIRFLFLTLFGIALMIAIDIVMFGGVFVLREVVRDWYGVDIFEKIKEWFHARA